MLRHLNLDFVININHAYQNSEKGKVFPRLLVPSIPLGGLCPLKIPSYAYILYKIISKDKHLIRTPNMPGAELSTCIVPFHPHNKPKSGWGHCYYLSGADELGSTQRG